MIPLLTAAQVRAADAKAIEQARVPGLVLMENAGLCTFLEIEKRFESVAGLRAVVVCGKGNNGGDGFVIARHLHVRGAEVTAFLLGKKADVKGDAKANLDAWVGIGGELVENASTPAKFEELRAALSEAALVVDAILGTGLSGAVEAKTADAIEAINDSPGFVVAVDVPSGMDSDTGQILGDAVWADLTCTYGAMKVGQWQYPGRECCGELVLVPLPMPPEFLGESAEHALLGEEDVPHQLLHRPATAHKGYFGHLLVVAGSHGKSGAAVLASRAAGRVGAGLVTLAVSRNLEAVVAPQSPETMTALVDENASGGVAASAGGELLKLAAERSGVVIGPGIPTDAESSKAFLEFLKSVKTPLVIDADGLNLLASSKTRPQDLASKMVIVTPHPGEMARLTGKSAAQVQESRITIAREYAKSEGVICVLKGAGTVIADPAGAVFLSPSGNPALASGGTGDVLAGMIGGLLVQEGVSPLEACCAGVILHGLAADRIVEKKGAEPALLAGDLIEELPDVFRSLPHDHGHSEDGPGGCGEDS